jgi:glycosyltransferase involved in cell wall biosynthesis
MAITVLNVAYPLAAVGPQAVGGAEQVVSMLDRMLVRAGVRSLVVAREDSHCEGVLLPVPAVREPLRNHLHPAAQAACREAIASALTRWQVDVIHLHGLDFPAYLPPPGPPVLVTLHLPVAFYAPDAFRIGRPATYLHCVSRSQRRQFPASLEMLPEIENGVAWQDFDVRHGKRGYVLGVGRICWEKGFHVALDAAAKARVPMLLGGQVFPFAEHERYFRQEIAPRLDRSRRFLGPLDLIRKRRLLAGARALLVSSLVPETGSLVAMEALACGTPVVAFRSGALVDVVEHGVTGYLVDDVDAMADAIPAAAQLSPMACREAARRRFSADRMIQRYLEVYTTLATEHASRARAEVSYAA